MPDEVTITPKSESTPANNAGENQNISASLSQIISLAALGLGVSFFLPWVQIWGATLSGFDLQKMHGGHLLLWLIPIFSALTIFAGITKRSQRNAAQLAGTLPFLVLIYWLYQMGSDLMHVIAIGGYLSLGCGAALLILPRRIK